MNLISVVTARSLNKQIEFLNLFPIYFYDCKAMKTPIKIACNDIYTLQIPTYDIPTHCGVTRVLKLLKLRAVSYACIVQIVNVYNIETLTTLHPIIQLYRYTVFHAHIGNHQDK